MVDEKEPAEEGGKSDAGIFGPLINLIHQARKIHPAAGYLLIILALIAVAAFIYNMLGDMAGGGELPGLLRIILFSVILLLFLMLLVAFFADVISPSEKQRKGVQLGRGIMLLIMIGGGGIIGWQSNRSCEFGEIIWGGEKCADQNTLPNDKDEPEVPPVAELPPKEEEAPPVVEPEVPKKVVFGGFVANMKPGKEDYATIPGLSIVIRVPGRQNPLKPKLSKINSFMVELPRQVIGSRIRISAKAPGFQALPPKEVRIIEPVNGLENADHAWAMAPVSAPPPPKNPVFKLPANYEARFKNAVLRKSISKPAR